MVEDRDRGWKNFLENMRFLESKELKIGIQGKDAEEAKKERTVDGIVTGPASLLEIATHHEFGAPKANIPERSYIRSTTDEQRQAMDRAIANIVEEAAKGASIKELQVLLRALGVFVQDKIQAKIVALKFPPLKLATKRRKARTVVGKSDREAFIAGAGNPLVDTFQLGGSITFAIVKAT